MSRRASRRFEQDVYMREPAGDEHIHRGADELRALYRSFVTNGGGIPLSAAPSPTTSARRACV
jgi:hypothetical protein